MVDPVNRIADDHEIPFISDQEFDRTIRQAFDIGWVGSLAAQTLLRPRMAVSEPPNVYSSQITKMTKWTLSHFSPGQPPDPDTSNRHLFCMCSRYSLLSKYGNEELVLRPTASATKTH